MIEELQNQNRQTIYLLGSKAYFYYARSNELNKTYTNIRK
jgi:hypothetical protein